MRACGFTHLKLARPALLLGALFTLLLIALTSFISPRGYAEMQQMRSHLKSEYTAFLLRDGVFNTFGRNLTVYVRKRSGEGDLLGLLIHDARDSDRPPVTITAKRGRLVTDGESPQIVVYDGMRQQLDRRADSLTKLHFARYTIEVKGFADTRPTRWREASERTLVELFNPDMSVRADRAAADDFYAEAHHRIAMPFNALSFTAVALACLMLGSFNRRGQARKIMLAAGLVILLQTVDLGVLSLVKEHRALVPLVYVVSLGPLLVSLFLMTFRGEQAFNALRARLHRQKKAPLPAAGGAA
jgi:lipopolysaccharide export system permease protein